MAKETVVDEVNLAYDDNDFFWERLHNSKTFRPTFNYSCPAPKISTDWCGQLTIEDWKKYEQELDKRFGNDNKLIRQLTNRAKRNPKRIVFSRAEHYKVLKAIEQVDEGIVLTPVLLGRREKRLKT